MILKNNANKVGFDVLLLENSKIKKHWSNITNKAPNNPSGHSQVDGSTKIIDQQHTQKNKNIVKNFINNVFIKIQVVLMNTLIKTHIFNIIVILRWH